MNNENAHIGSSLDALLRDEGVLNAVNETAQARVEAWESSVSDGATGLRKNQCRIFSNTNP